MLQITLTEGTELKIGDDVRIIFREAAFGRARVAVEAPREIPIKRIKFGADEADAGRNSSAAVPGGKGNIYIAKGSSRACEREMA